MESPGPLDLRTVILLAGAGVAGYLAYNSAQWAAALTVAFAVLVTLHMMMRDK
jgi:fatty acid desaturase